MSDKLTLIGKIGFEPTNKTKKHEKQSEWKYIAMVLLDGDITDYYSWFIKKRFNLELNNPLRDAHISFINDSYKDLSLQGKRSKEEVTEIWERVKDRWDGKEIPIMLNLSPVTNGKYWWLDVHNDYKNKLQGIRSELGLKKPFYDFHMTIGFANEKWREHSKYIQTLIKSGLI